MERQLFSFVNRNRDQLKLLFWDRDGYCIWHKRWSGARISSSVTADAHGGGTHVCSAGPLAGRDDREVTEQLEWEPSCLYVYPGGCAIDLCSPSAAAGKRTDAGRTERA